MQTAKLTVKSEERVSRMSRDRVEKDKNHSLKGTLTSVLLLGGFIALSWLGVYMVFINR
jgi:hypothetical protein